ncbi:MAG TPA: MerR family transcriptional regulator, partial [Chryseobacterium sp.]|nr:MerR family transcriptional regulator [Chryseobacterium sp.]
MSERISREELVKIYNIEITFFDSLEEAGLLKTVTENEVKYLLYDELELFERFANWHY